MPTTPLLVVMAVIACAAASNQTSTCQSLSGPFCSDVACYHSSHHTQQGFVDSFGCLSSISPFHPLSAACLRSLNDTRRDSVCLETGASVFCCCSGQRECNAQWHKGTQVSALGWCAYLFLLFFGMILAGGAVMAGRVHRWVGVPFHTVAGWLRRYLAGSLAVEIALSTCTALLFWLPLGQTCKKHELGEYRPSLYLPLSVLDGHPIAVLAALIPLHNAAVSMGLLRHTVRASPSLLELVPFAAIRAGTHLLTIANTMLLADYLVPQLPLLNPDSPLDCHIQHAHVYWTLLPLLVYVSSCLSLCSTLIGCWRLARAPPTPFDASSIEDDSATETVHTPLNTACSNTTVLEKDHLAVHSSPLVLTGSSPTVLTVENRHTEQWIAFRVLVSAPLHYSIRPQKVVLPPQRHATVEVTLRNPRSDTFEHCLMLEWFVVGTCCPSRDVASFWQRPHFRPRSQWKHYVMPIYHEPQEY